MGLPPPLFRKRNDISHSNEPKAAAAEVRGPDRGEKKKKKKKGFFPLLLLFNYCCTLAAQSLQIRPLWNTSRLWWRWNMCFPVRLHLYILSLKWTHTHTHLDLILWLRSDQLLSLSWRWEAPRWAESQQDQLFKEKKERVHTRTHSYTLVHISRQPVVSSVRTPGI